MITSTKKAVDLLIICSLMIRIHHRFREPSSYHPHTDLQSRPRVVAGRLSKSVGFIHHNFVFMLKLHYII